MLDDIRDKVLEHDIEIEMLKTTDIERGQSIIRVENKVDDVLKWQRRTLWTLVIFMLGLLFKNEFDFQGAMDDVITTLKYIKEVLSIGT